MLHKTEGIVIRSKDYGEAHKIITIFSPTLGKISLMARGAKKTRSRLSSLCQLFTHGQYLFYLANPKTMGTLSQGEIINSFRYLRVNLLQTAYAAYFAELVDRFTDDGERNAYLFDLILSMYRYLEEEKDPDILARIFEIKMLITGGYQPQLTQCLNCGRKEGRFTFSVQEGGFICQDCQHLDPTPLVLSTASIKLLQLFYYLDHHRLGNIDVKESTKQELRQALWQFMDHHTPLVLKSRAFLEQMDNFM